MPAGGRPTVRSRRLGGALKRYREAAKLDQQHAAEHIAGSNTKISRIETGQVSARPGDVRLMLELYGVEDREVYLQLEQLARDSNKRGWWLDFPFVTRDEGFTDVVTLETDANYIQTWHPLFIPGMLQTDEYVRTLLRHKAVRDNQIVDEAVAIRQARRKIITDKGTEFAAVIWEPALTAPMPSAETHRKQLQHILDLAERPNVSVQVLPLSEWQAAHLSTHFTMFNFGPEPGPQAVAYDTTTSSVLFEDLAEMATHARIFEELRSAALTREQSVAFVRKAMEDIPRSEEEEA